MTAQQVRQSASQSHRSVVNFPGAAWPAGWTATGIAWTSIVGAIAWTGATGVSIMMGVAVGRGAAALAASFSSQASFIVLEELPQAAQQATGGAERYLSSPRDVGIGG